MSLGLTNYSNYRTGFIEDYSTSYTTSYVGNQPINLLPTKSVYVLSNLVDYKNETSNKHLDGVLLKFPLTSNFGSICYYSGSMTTDYIQVDRTSNFLGMVDFKLLDDWGNELDLNGGSFSISIIFTLP